MLNRELDSVISRIQIVFSFVCREKVEQLGYITLSDKPWSLRHSFRADVIMPGGRWPETENKRICQTVSSCRFLLGLPIFRGRGRLRNLSGVRLRKRKWKKMIRTHDRRSIIVSSNWQPRQHVPVKWFPPLEGDGNYFLTPLSYYGWQWTRRKFRHPWTWSERYRETISTIKQKNRIAAASDISGFGPNYSQSNWAD